jgi:predicted transcriptional regulator YdeE
MWNPSAVLPTLALLTLTLVPTGGAQAQDAPLQPQTVELKPFQVVGIWTSTNNQKEVGADGVIGKEWHRFLSEGLLSKIPDRVDHSIIAVYTDYASDARSQYSFVLGAKVRPVPNPVVPEGMVVKTVAGGKYAVFTTPRGPASTVVPATWKRIWKYFEQPQNGQRAYQADFEVYDERAADPNNAQVDIYIGTK